MIEFISAFLLGTLSIFSPCSFVIIPIIASDLKAKLSRITLFLVGILTTYMLLGIGAIFTGKLLTSFLGGWLYVLAGSITLLAGLQMFGAFHIQLPSFQTSAKSAYGKGIIFGGVILSCATPLLAAVLALITTAQNSLAGLFIMFLFSLGFISPFLVFSFLITDHQISDKILKYNNYITYMGGFLLIGVSLYLFYIALRGVI